MDGGLPIVRTIDEYSYVREGRIISVHKGEFFRVDCRPNSRYLSVTRLLDNSHLFLPARVVEAGLLGHSVFEFGANILQAQPQSFSCSMQSSDGPSIKSDSCAADEVLVSRSTKGPHESSETLKTEVLLRSSSPKPHPRFKRSAISLVSETDGSGDRETGEDVEADDKVDSPLRVVDLLKSCESVEQSKDPVSSPSMVQTRWRRDLDRGQEVFVDQKTNEKWAPAVDNDGRTYYYEVNSRHSVWTLADLDCLVDPLISPLSDPLLGRPRTAIYDEPNVSDGADNDNWSDSSFEYAVSPTLQTSEEKDKRNSKAVDENEAGNEKKQKPTKSKSSSRLAALARFKSGRSDLTPIDQPDQPSSDKAYRFEVTRIGKEHISGPKQNKLMNFERRGLVNRTKYIEDGQRVHKRWNPCLLVLSGPWLLFYKESKSSAPKVTLPHGKPEFKLHVQQMEVADAPEGDTSRKNVLRFEVNSTNDTKTVYLVQFPENVLESWKAAVRYAKELLVRLLFQL
ncbi:unnamed protein product [Calicophoron daubneyi]|uniref:PH domain-containing protein n=1 Tax=Calicophoron daubneyi TaxID=300641 RepID=A0AAV2U184_CALDB